VRSSELVTVVIPLFNASTTIERTLASVNAQTWPEIEVLVVDDGSTDDGASRVARMISGNPRTRLLQQQNQGVASARNLGAAHAAGNYLAFIDADDLWAPQKIARQMQSMREGGARVGLSYTWSAAIDALDRIISLGQRSEAEGQVFRDICRWNIVGNGSSTLIRRSAFDEVGGYDSSLRARGAQGCEDLMLYLRIAERREFRVVREFLTGYRVTSDSMSSNALIMLRSCELALDTFRGRYPQYASEFRDHRRDLLYSHIVRALTTGPINNVAALLGAAGMSGSFRSGSLPLLLWMTLKALAPLPAKSFLRQLLNRGGNYGRTYLEVQA
jgi:glycosyltransferase involved in cell wall biosynthesis